MGTYRLAIILTFFVMFAFPSLAEPCAMRPSDALGSFGTGAAATSGAAVSGAGAAMQGAGFYTLTHSTSGAVMLASTAGDASAAGTVGIMGGTAGTVGTVAGMLMAPATIVAAGTAAVGVGGWEGYCAYQKNRITDEGSVRAALRERAGRSDIGSFLLIETGQESDFVVLPNSDGGHNVYLVKNLYIANGDLMHRDWLLNTNLGPM